MGISPYNPFWADLLLNYLLSNQRQVYLVLPVPPLHTDLKGLLPIVALHDRIYKPCWITLQALRVYSIADLEPSRKDVYTKFIGCDSCSV